VLISYPVFRLTRQTPLPVPSDGPYL
jgi:hypothetical protein